MNTPTLDLARALVARPSVTPKDEGCQDLIAARLKSLGFKLEPMRFGNVQNLWARRGQTAPLVVFAGHTDVVPTGPLDRWMNDPFSPTIREGNLFGRGAADMKTSIAAFTTAVEAYLEDHPNHLGSIAFLLTSDEEGPAVDGTVRVVEALRARGERLDYCIVGEPTSAERFGDTVKNGRRGSLSGHLVVRGIQGHVAYPQFARNPVHQAAPAIAELAATEWDKGNAFFPPTTWQISNVHAGTGANNVIPGAFDLEFNFRFSTASTVDGLKSRLQAILDRHGLEYAVEWVIGAEPYLTRPGRLVEAVSTAIERVTGIRPTLSTTGGTSDGRFLATWSCEVIEVGPLNATIHKLNECVRLTDIEGLHRIYYETLAILLAEKN
ncbi:MAG: succinyl-diaminopimelate desuccinylase [Polyangiaceae bacterium]